MNMFWELLETVIKCFGISELENRVTDYDVIKQVKLNYDVIAIFSLIFRNSGFLMNIKFPIYITRKFLFHLITLKFPSYATPKFKFHLKFRVTYWKNHLNFYAKFSANICDLPAFQALLLIGLLI